MTKGASVAANRADSKSASGGSNPPAPAIVVVEIERRALTELNEHRLWPAFGVCISGFEYVFPEQTLLRIKCEHALEPECCCGKCFRLRLVAYIREDDLTIEETLDLEEELYKYIIKNTRYQERRLFVTSVNYE